MVGDSTPTSKEGDIQFSTPTDPDSAYTLWEEEEEEERCREGRGGGGGGGLRAEASAEPSRSQLARRAAVYDCTQNIILQKTTFCLPLSYFTF